MRKKRLVETFSLATFGTQIKDSPTYLKDYLCKATKIIKAVNLSQRPCLTNKATPLLIFVPKYWRNLCLPVFLTRLSAVRGLQVDKGGCCRNPEQSGSTNMKPWSEEIQEKPEKCLKRRKLGAGGSERRPAGRVTLLLVGGSVGGGRWVGHIHF